MPEQHFLGYKSIAAIENGFKKMIQKELPFWMWAEKPADFPV